MSLLIDPRRTLVVRAPTERMNPTHDAAAIELERQRDPVNAAAEYDGIPRSDSSLLYDEAWIEAAVDHGIFQRDPIFKFGAGETVVRHAWSDTSGGGRCQMTLAIARKENGRAVLEYAKGFSRKEKRQAVVAEIAQTLKRYGLSTLHRDAYGGDLVTALFAEHQITATYAHKAEMGGTEPAKVTTSYVFLESVSLFATGRITLLDHSQLKQELLQLERRAGSSGNDKAGKPPTGFDDLAAAVVGACWLCARVGTATTGDVVIIPSQVARALSDGALSPSQDRYLDAEMAREWDLMKLSGGRLPN